jgi:hypothetical protein
MRLLALLFTAVLLAAPLRAQQPPASAQPDPASLPQDTATGEKGPKNRELNLPVSLDKIRQGLQQPAGFSLRSVDERPIFRVQILERQKIEELLASLTFKNAPIPAGGVYMFEQQRQMFNPVDHPLMQPYSAFSGNELLTILVENLVGKYLGGKLVNTISKAERARAEAAARDEVNVAVAEYCNAQPHAGEGLQLCSNIRR